MASASPIDATKTCGTSSSSDYMSSRGALSMPVPDETSTLLQHRSAQMEETVSERGRSSTSAFVDRNAGLLLVAGSEFFFSAINVSVKWINNLDEPVPILEQIWVRMAMTYILSVAYMFLRKVPHPLIGPKDARALLVLRGISGFISLSGGYFSLQYLSLSDATVLTFLAPILTAFSGAIFLKETVSLKDMCAGLCSFFGVILIARPRSLFGSRKGELSEVVVPWQRMFSVVAALIGVLGTTGSYTLLRAIGKRAHSLHSLAYFSLQSVIFSTIGMIAFKMPPVIPTRVLWFVMLFLIGILGLIALTLLTLGLQRETASRSTLAVYTSIVFAVLFEFVIFHTTPSAPSIAGAAIIMSSAVYTTLTKKTVIKPVPSPILDRPALTTPDCDANGLQQPSGSLLPQVLSSHKA
ncbi:hypothetical protein BGW80DRAFT_1559449 [Lactifluus volemus]|nr:hypothetical protein BGW80DRAFT_1559449 [Lactifluus volemus]